MVMKERIGYIDVVKGFAICLVVLGHILPRHTNAISICIYSFHMPIFFVISGMLHRMKETNDHNVQDTKLGQTAVVSDSLGGVICNKLKNVLYPYLTFSLIAIFLLLLYGSTDSCFQAIKLTICFDGYSALWFLPSFLIAEVLSEFCLYFGQNKWWLILCITVDVLLLTMILTYYIPDNAWILHAYQIFGRVLLGFIFIQVGYLFEFSRVNFLIMRKKILCIFIGIALVGINIFLSQLNPNVDMHYFIIGNPFLYFINAICGSFGVIIIIEQLLNKFKPFEFMGRNSLIIMATHLPLPVLALSGKIVVKCFSVENLIINYSLKFVLCITMEVIIVLVVNRYFRFIVSFDELKKIKESAKWVKPK